MYTIEDHMRRVKYLLMETDSPELFCPASIIEYNCIEEHIKSVQTHDNHLNGDQVCRICLDFLGIQEPTDMGCPCQILGKKETIKRAIEKIKMLT